MVRVLQEIERDEEDVQSAYVLLLPMALLTASLPIARRSRLSLGKTGSAIYLENSDRLICLIPIRTQQEKQLT